MREEVEEENVHPNVGRWLFVQMSSSTLTFVIGNIYWQCNYNGRCSARNVVQEEEKRMSNIIVKWADHVLYPLRRAGIRISRSNILPLVHRLLLAGWLTTYSGLWGNKARMEFHCDVNKINVTFVEITATTCRWCCNTTSHQGDTIESWGGGYGKNLWR